MSDLRCPICDSTFHIPNSHAHKRRTCSKECGKEYRKSHLNTGCFNVGHGQSNTGKTWFKKGHKPSEKAIEQGRIRFSLNKGKKLPHRQGQNCPRWKGGITPINHAIRTSIDFINWRRQVFERDNYACQICGCRNGDGKSHFLHAHHVKRFAEYPSLRFDVANGMTLCNACHKIADQISNVTKNLESREVLCKTI